MDEEVTVMPDDALLGQAADLVGIVRAYTDKDGLMSDRGYVRVADALRTVQRAAVSSWANEATRHIELCKNAKMTPCSWCIGMVEAHNRRFGLTGEGN